ncbi:hypothetical protein J6590_027516 [Homalodisca vitripennis]|nr:hypothetical protein J6590_027516 [Homalodisca vitripennis]
MDDLTIRHLAAPATAATFVQAVSEISLASTHVFLIFIDERSFSLSHLSALGAATRSLLQPGLKTGLFAYTMEIGSRTLDCRRADRLSAKLLQTASGTRGLKNSGLEQNIRKSKELVQRDVWTINILQSVMHSDGTGDVPMLCTGRLEPVVHRLWNRSVWLHLARTREGNTSPDKKLINCTQSYKNLSAASEVTGYSGWVRLGGPKGRIRTLISNSEPASPVKAGRRWHTLVETSKNLCYLGTEPHQLQQSSPAVD